MRLPPRRRWTGLGVAILGPPAATALLTAARGELELGTVLLLYLLLVVVTAAVGGLGPAVLAAIASFLLANWFFVPPFHTLSVESRDSVLELLVFLVVAAIVSLIVHLAAREQARAERGRFEARLLARFTAEPVSSLTTTDVLEEIRATFGMDGAALVRVDDPRTVLAAVGIPLLDRPSLVVPAGGGLMVHAHGQTPFGEDRALLARLAAAAARAWEAQELAEEAARARDLAAADRVRSALLAAVGHDLRTPLAAIKASVSSLRAEDVEWPPAERAELLATIEHGADRLDALIANLLDLSRLQTDSLAVGLMPVAVDEVVGRALLQTSEADVVVRIPDDLPLVLADPGLLERVVANVVDNARRYSPPGTPVLVEAAVRHGTLRLAVVDRGPGVAHGDRTRMFVPFQRLDDRSAGSEVGLGLAIAKGFTEACGGSLTPSDTPGGGLTLTITLPLAEAP
jgi:K+-sensing histidine kinase KdpD